MDQAVAIVATHLGCVDEEKINDMSIPFFDDVFATLSDKLVYDGIVNYAGNSFCKDSWDMIMKHYPMKEHQTKGSQAMSQLGSLFNSTKIKVVKPGEISGKG